MPVFSCVQTPYTDLYTVLIVYTAAPFSLRLDLFLTKDSEVYKEGLEI